MAKKYPYIQHKEIKEDGICSICKKRKQITTLEWRVDIFQGNCELEDICQSCFDKRENEEEKKRNEYYKQMQPILEKREKIREEKEAKMIGAIKEITPLIKMYDNGQWAIGNKLDWWTTTGTAIERRSKKRHYLTFRDTVKIKQLLKSIIN